MKKWIGEIFTTNEGYKAEIISITFGKCVILLDNKYTLSNITVQNVKNGQIKNPYHPSVCGIGYFGEGEYLSSVNKKPTKQYIKWHLMITRCYSNTKRLPPYKDCIVDERWHNFQTFAKWFDENYVEGWELDKDLICPSCKTYSAETCCFLPPIINKKLIKTKNCKGYYQVRNKFRVVVNGVHISYTKTEREASELYIKHKALFFKELLKDYEKYMNINVYKILTNEKNI